MGCSIALPRNDVVVSTLHWPVCKSRPYLFLPLEIRSCWVSRPSQLRLVPKVCHNPKLGPERQWQSKGHRYREFTEAAARRAQEINFYKSVGMIAGQLFFCKWAGAWRFPRLEAAEARRPQNA